jgi:hypothetical protein
MAVPPESFGKHVAGFKDIQLSQDGRFVRIVFVGLDRKTEIPLQIGSDLLFKMMPLLLQAHGDAERRFKGKNERQVYQIKEGEIQTTATGSIVFDFKISTGQHFAFEVDKTSARNLLASLSIALGLTKNESGEDVPPRKH